jgi:hypothetical protein
MHESLANMYQLNFALMQHHKYGLAELEEMIPFERDIYVSMLLAYLKDKEEKSKSR